MDDVCFRRNGDGLVGRRRSPNPHGGPIGSGPSAVVAGGQIAQQRAGRRVQASFQPPNRTWVGLGSIAKQINPIGRPQNPKT